MTKITRLDGNVIAEDDLATIKETLEAAVGRRDDLRRANLRRAYLSGAYLSGAKGIWWSHDVIAEILRRAARQDVEKRKIAGLILISRDWCWGNFLRIDSPLREWVFETLAPWAVNNPTAPDVMRNYVAAREVTA